MRQLGFRGLFGSCPPRVKVVEVGPRDGLQNEKTHLSAALKIQLIDRLVDSGLKVVEATAFVSPKAVPQMADHAEVLKGLRKKEGISFPVLVPNQKGYLNAVSSGAQEVAIFGSASEAFSQANIKCSIEESFSRFEEVIASAKQDNIRVRGYVSCISHDPFSGPVPSSSTAAVALRLYKMGCYEISLGDTTGTANSVKIADVIENVVNAGVPIENIAVHCHDTYGQALANILTALQMGVSVVDSSVSGLGGCPYAPGSSGNVATEDVVYMLNEMGIETGIDLNKLVEVGQWISKHLSRTPASKVNLALTHKLSKK